MEQKLGARAGSDTATIVSSIAAADYRHLADAIRKLTAN
jgi:hypothetical protein